MIQFKSLAKLVIYLHVCEYAYASNAWIVSASSLRASARPFVPNEIKTPPPAYKSTHNPLPPPPAYSAQHLFLPPPRYKSLLPRYISPPSYVMPVRKSQLEAEAKSNDNLATAVIGGAR